MQDRDSNRDDDAEDGEDSDFDFGVIRDYLGYALRAVKLHPLLAAGVFVAIVGATFGALRALPKTYHVESKLLAQRDAMVGHANPFSPDPLKGAADIVMGHANLLLLVKQLDLVPWWREHLAPAQRFKARVFSLFTKEATDEDQERTLVQMLETKMTSWPGENTVTIAIDWNDGAMGARIVDTAEQNFLEQRHVMEIATVAESVSILEGHAARMREEFRAMTQDHQTPEEKPAKDAAPAGPAGARAVPAPPQATSVRRVMRRRPGADADLTRQKVMIDAKQQAINDLEQFRQRRVLDLQASLAEQRSKFTDAHPVIVGIQQNIAAISRESPQVAALRAEVKTLQERYDQSVRDAESVEVAGGGGGGAAAPAGVVASGPEDVAGMLQSLRGGKADPALEAQARYVLDKYSEIRAQISAARIELDNAQASFRYRYTVVVPAEPPKAPSKPKVPVIMAAATIAGLLFGVLAATIAEIRSGQFVSRWQVERMLKLPVLAELRLPGGERPRDPS